MEVALAFCHQKGFMYIKGIIGNPFKNFLATFYSASIIKGPEHGLQFCSTVLTILSSLSQ